MKHTPVAEVSAISTMKALMLAPDTPIEDAIEQYSSNEGQHGIFLVDDGGRLLGLVNDQEMLDWARIQFDLPPGVLPLPVHRLRRFLNARSISDLALRESQEMAVKLTDTLGDALAKMAEYGLDDIAVIDEDGRVVNDLRLSEVLAFALQVRNQRG